MLLALLSGSIPGKQLNAFVNAAFSISGFVLDKSACYFCKISY